MYIESEESKNMMKLNEDYLDVYYSSAYQKYINKNVRKLSLGRLWDELIVCSILNRL